MYRLSYSDKINGLDFSMCEFVSLSCTGCAILQKLVGQILEEYEGICWLPCIGCDILPKWFRFSSFKSMRQFG